MIRAEIEELEKQIMHRFVTRQKLGYASYEGEEILDLWKIQLKIIQHIRESVLKAESKKPKTK